MRTDITIDRKQVKRLPNASHLGYDKYKAQVGDLILFTENVGGFGVTRTGRMIGRIDYDPITSPTKGNCTGFLVVAVLNEELSHIYERWVSPDEVTRVQPISTEYVNRLDVVKWFLSEEMISQPTEEVRKCITDGWSTWDKYEEHKRKREQENREFDERHKDCDSSPCDFCQKFGLRGAKREAK